MMGQESARINGKKVPTLNLNGITGADWIFWRLFPLVGLGYRGRRRLFRKIVKAYSYTNERLTETPFAVSLPGGMAYRVLDTVGNHRSVYDEQETSSGT